MPEAAGERWTRSLLRFQNGDRQGALEDVEWLLEQTGGFGADYTFDATGNVAVMRQAVEAARMGWGLCTVAGVAGKAVLHVD